VADGIERDLRRLAGEMPILSGGSAAPYRHDQTIQRGIAGEPAAVVLPTSLRQLACVVAYCHRQGLAIVPRGGGTGLVGGATPLGGEVVVSTELLRSFSWKEEALGLLAVEAGVSTATVARLARERGWYFGPDPGGADRSTIGGNVATNAGGPHALKYGRTGAYVVGVRAVVGEGELLELGEWGRREGGGYDLLGLLVGSEGTLGIVAEVVLRLRPAPGATAAGAVVCSDPQSCQAAVVAILESGLAPAVLDFVDGATAAAASGSSPLAQRGVGAEEVVLLVEADGGDGPEAHRRLRDIFMLVSEVGDCRADRLPGAALWEWRDGLGPFAAAELGGRVADDVYCPPPKLARALAGIRALGARYRVPCRIWGHAGEGVVHASFLFARELAEQRAAAESAAEEALDLILSLGGGICGEHGVGVVKARRYAQITDPALLQREWALKEAIDPGGLFNPGKKLLAPQPAKAG